MLVVSWRLFGLQTRDLVLDVHFGIGADVLELLDLGFELGDGLFEVQECDGHQGFNCLV